MGNDLTLLYKYKADDADNFYARRYLEEGKKTLFLENIKEKTKAKLQQDPNYIPKKITDPLLIQESFSQYLLMDKKEKLYLLFDHPALSKEDFKELLEMSVKTTEKSFYAALGGSIGTFLIYKKFIERHHLFYNFFRAKSRFRAVNIMKNVFRSLALFYSWLGMANYFYKEKLRREISEKGYYKKYFIDTEGVYVEDDF